MLRKIDAFKLALFLSIPFACLPASAQESAERILQTQHLRWQGLMLAQGQYVPAQSTAQGQIQGQSSPVAGPYPAQQGQFAAPGQYAPQSQFPAPGQYAPSQGAAAGQYAAPGQVPPPGQYAPQAQFPQGQYAPQGQLPMPGQNVPPVQFSAPGPFPVQGQFPAQGSYATQGQYPAQGQFPPQGQFVPQQVPLTPIQGQGQGLRGSASLFSMPEKIFDFNSGRCRKMEFDFLGGQFQDAAVDSLHLSAQDLDMKLGQLGSLDILLKGGHFADLTVDQLHISSSNPLTFNTDSLLNRRIFEFTSPGQAKVSAIISQNSLNHFVSAPRTLEMLSAGAQSHMPSFIGQLIGAAFQVKFSSAAIRLLPESKVQVDVTAAIDVLHSANSVPLTLLTRLGLKEDGWVSLSDTKILTSGQEISPEISAMVVSRMNRLVEWGSHNDDMHFTFTKLTVIPGDRIELSGTAQLKRLRFGS